MGCLNIETNNLCRLMQTMKMYKLYSSILEYKNKGV